MNLDSKSAARSDGGVHLSPQQREILARLFTSRRFPKNATILRRGEHSDVLFVVQGGTVELSTDTEWNHATVVRKREGDVFGENILLGDGISPCQAIAIDDSELCILDRSDLDELSARRQRFSWRSSAVLPGGCVRFPARSRIRRSGGSAISLKRYRRWRLVSRTC